MTTQSQTIFSYVLAPWGGCWCFMLRLSSTSLAALNLSITDWFKGAWSNCQQLCESLQLHPDENAGDVGCLNKHSQFVRVAESKRIPRH
jgi:hypothetical protein